MLAAIVYDINLITRYLKCISCGLALEVVMFVEIEPFGELWVRLSSRVLPQIR
jgi:hypothetical protein